MIVRIHDIIKLLQNVAFVINFEKSMLTIPKVCNRFSDNEILPTSRKGSERAARVLQVCHDRESFMTAPSFPAPRLFRFFLPSSLGSPTYTFTDTYNTPSTASSVEQCFVSGNSLPRTPALEELQCISETPPRQHNGYFLYKQPRRYSFPQSHVTDT